jgi:hypothetical protein
MFMGIEIRRDKSHPDQLFIGQGLKGGAAL